ncbi:sphingomyelin phosphodiesterase 4-like [Diadema antillarum]|uniref:sphingomyelin phosphodiesterase 4-like n=1 Tax=Diadema antillarum TaxID=105358 RepID=UPI003A8AC3C9
MAATMSWTSFAGGSASLPKNSDELSTLKSQVQSYCSTIFPVKTRCLELESLIKRSSSKDLHGVYPLILDAIYGLNGHQGWNLHDLSNYISREDFKALQDFLSPSGPVFSMVYKLQSDQYLRYEFPVDKLPAPTRQSLMAGIIPPFYHGKVAYQSHGRAPSAVMLNAFEYYMYIFAYFLVSDRVHQSMNTWAQPQDCFYPVLLDQYLSYFLRSDGRSIPPVPITTSTPSPNASHLSPYRLPQYGVLYHYLHTNTTAPHHHHRDPMHHGDSSFGLHPQSPHPYHHIHHQHHHHLRSSLGPSPGGGDGMAGGSSHSLGFQQSIQDDPLGETWRSEVLVQALTEFWLNQNSLKMLTEKSFLAQVKENFVPSQDHVRVVRILVKRLHFFVNSAQPALHQSAYQQRGDSALEQLKRHILPLFVQQPLYVFLRHGFDNFPLDSSFRQILELWLSYIQPWRYVDEAQRAGTFQRDLGQSPQSQALTYRAYSREPRTFPVNDERWQRFVRENLPFYTVLFQELLPRIFHQDLIPNNALMVYRVAKVFGQEHLGAVLKDEEEQLVDLLCHQSQPYSSLNTNPGFTPLLSPMSSSSASSLTPRAVMHLFEVEAAGFVYRPLFSNEGKALIQQLLGFVTQAQVTAKTMAGPGLGNITQMIKSLFTRSNRHANHSVLFDDIGPVDARKTEAYLQSTAEFLSDTFDVPMPHPEDMMNWNVGQMGRDLHLPPDKMDGQLTQLGRYQLINRLRSSDACYQGDPDLQPIRTYENAALVRVLHALSCHFNENFGDRIQEMCSQGGLLGAMARWYFAPRGLALSQWHDQTERVPSWAHPRLSLRFLAHYRTLTYLALLYLLLWYVWDVTPTGFVLLLLVGLLFVGFVGASFNYLRGETSGDFSPQVRVYARHHHDHQDLHHQHVD